MVEKKENGLGNVVIEGTYPCDGDSDNCYFGMYRMPIRERTEVIVERIEGRHRRYQRHRRHRGKRRNKFVLYGKVSNGGRITKIDKKSLRGNGFTTKLKNPISETGMVKTGVIGIVRPRVILVMNSKDSRIFIEEKTMRDLVYMSVISDKIRFAWRFLMIYREKAEEPADEEEKNSGITDWFNWGVM